MMEATAKNSPSFSWKVFHAFHFCVSIGLVIVVVHDKLIDKRQLPIQSYEFHGESKSEETDKRDELIDKRHSQVQLGRFDVNKSRETDRHFIVKRDEPFIPPLTPGDKPTKSARNYPMKKKVGKDSEREVVACLDMLRSFVKVIKKDVHTANLTRIRQIAAEICMNNTSDESSNLNICGQLRGPPGKPGSRGPRGKRGNKGPRGLLGQNGSKGSTGKHGPPGPRGEKGFSGNVTVIGLKGDAGPKGYKGDKGDPGARGPQGHNGPKGDFGGPKGDRGEKGDVGQRGCSGESFAAPRFLASPQDLVFTEREDAILVCNATANPYSHITWYRDNVTLPAANGRYAVRQNVTIPQGQSSPKTNCDIKTHPVSQSSLVIKRSRGSDSGKYFCKARNVMGVFTYDVKLLIQVYVKFTTKPKDITAVEKENVRLSCRASGVPSPLITWQRKDDQPMPNRYRVAMGDLHISNIAKQDEGVYVCVASNVLGSETTEATITVNVFPKISLFWDQTVTMNESQTLHLPCNATGFPKPVISWHKMNGSLPKTRSNYDSQQLTVTDLKYIDRGEYVCTAKNSLGSDSKRTRVIVQVAPKVLQRPLATEFGFKGYNKILTFKVFAFPAATIEWRRDGKIIKTLDQENSNLILPSVQFTDSGIYQAVARNDLGQVSITTFLAVREPVLPIIISHFRDLNVKDILNSYLVQTCTSFGIPKPRIAWKFNGSTLAMSKIGDSLTLNITKPVKSGFGRYTCETSNRFGTTRRHFWLDKPRQFFRSATGSGRLGTIQIYVVPYSGVYQIRGGGARGGDHSYNYGLRPGTYNGGKGATMEGKFRLTAGTKINIVIGQRGGNSVEVAGGQKTTLTAAQLGKSVEDYAGTGGGGGTFVYTTENKLLIAAGGGGGASAGYHGVDGQSGMSGTASRGSVSSKSRGGGTNGNPGICNRAGASWHGGVGAGWLAQGCHRLRKENGERGGSRDQGWVGGQAGAMNSGLNGGPAPGAVGGFGGGGGGSEDNGASGGGGGYSGGGSGIIKQQAGGGGGSYCSGSSCRGVTGGNLNNDGFVEIYFYKKK